MYHTEDVDATLLFLPSKKYKMIESTTWIFQKRESLDFFSKGHS